MADSTTVNSIPKEIAAALAPGVTEPDYEALQGYRNALTVMCATQDAFNLFDNIGHGLDQPQLNGRYAVLANEIHSSLEKIYRRTMDEHDQAFLNAHECGWFFPLRNPPDMPATIVNALDETRTERKGVCHG